MVKEYAEGTKRDMSFNPSDILCSDRKEVLYRSIQFANFQELTYLQCNLRVYKNTTFK